MNETRPRSRYLEHADLTLLAVILTAILAGVLAGFLVIAMTVIFTMILIKALQDRLEPLLDQNTLQKFEKSRVRTRLTRRDIHVQGLNVHDVRMWLMNTMTSRNSAPKLS
ncbi:hypothetical protein K504DRAFT_137256 [Pleomassaria siparia CBS 279.74]|uniref:Uncharacterized protein n=1 Tax=Pleomassaria siparia CBS 279.74 TaxID=1314801 RepID=A0A6G1KLB1_9PLEO|nr:hypothetical protein K504DRAFT_137256 [Pleomassaria siparia CBS 279.74]